VRQLSASRKIKDFLRIIDMVEADQQEEKKVAPIVLCFSGYDPSGGAGLLADARACRSFDTFAVVVQTALVVQNTAGVRETFASTAAQIEAQFEALNDDLTFSAVKVGVIPTIDAVQSVARCLRKLKQANSELPIIIDPVFLPSNGKNWGGESLFEAIQNELFPFATLVTPNALEAAIIAGRQIENLEGMGEVAKQIQRQCGAKNVLIKGGHMAQLGGERRGDGSELLAIDVFYDGFHETNLRSRFLPDSAVRGTGCLLSSAITAQMAV
jgi:hydroxymethylpyrimidine kinase/phosphomethylpyrimidine kinase